MGASKKKAKFIAKGHLQQKLKQRNEKKKFQAMKDRKKNRFERNSDAPTKKGKKVNEAALAMHGAPKAAAAEEPDMMDEMDVDEFLNAEFLDSDDNASDFENEDGGNNDNEKDDIDMGGDDSSSEEEDEDALDPRYMTAYPAFDDGDAADDDDESDDNEKAEDDAAEGKMDVEGAAEEDDAPGIGRTTLTMELLAKAEKEAFDKTTMNGLRKMMKIFSDACRSSDAADVNKEGEIMYEIQSSTVYNRMMLSVLRKTHVAFAKLVGATGAAMDEENDDDSSQSASSKLKVDEKKWKKHSLLIRRFFSSTCYLLEQTTGQDIQSFVLRELAHYIPFVVPCPKTARRVLKALLKLWAKSLNNNVCMLAFVRIRDLALQMPFPFLELALKGIYITYMRNTKFTNEATLPHHVLLGNCVVELYGLDLSSSYQHAFIYIRQLAIAIRKTITSPSPGTFKAVLNWQFFNQLRVWTAVICAYPEENQLKPLVYPLSQLLFALVRLSSTIRYAPLRFHCVKLLQQIAFATNSFVPTSPVLLEVLNMPPFNTSYRNGKTKTTNEGKGRLELDLDLCVKLAKSNVESRRVHDLVIAKLFELLQRECDVYKFHIGFPEFAVPLILTLTKFMKEGCSIPKWSSLAKGIIDSLKKRSEWIRVKRSALDVAPKDIEKLDAFLKDERENAVKKAFASDVEELKKKIATTSNATQQEHADSDDDSDDESDEEEKKVPAKKNKKKKQNKKQSSGAQPVDDETFAKVKKMSLQEFKKSVAAVDEEDKVEDFTFSDDDE
ncbi:Nucleolar complex protein, partial [Globisporangium splendens]